MQCPQKVSQMFLCYNLLLTYFYQIWHVAAAINAEQCVFKLSTSRGVYTHYLVML